MDRALRIRPPDEKRIWKMRRRQEVVAETASVVIRRRRSDAMPSPHALLEAPSTALLSSLFSIRRPYLFKNEDKRVCWCIGYQVAGDGSSPKSSLVLVVW